MSPSAKADPPRRPTWLTAIPYAHRGLHGAGRIENSRAAFEAAIGAGFGIELDVQLTADGECVVFHDHDLGRLTGREGRVSDLSVAELQRVKLNGAEETVPGLAQILALVADRAPLLIELKSRRRSVSRLCRSVSRALADYPGRAAIMSFNPQVGSWFARHSPEITRGLVVTESGKKNIRGSIERRLASWRARPDFLAYDIRDLPSPFASGERKRGLPVLTWTVRTQRDEEVAAQHADQIIHELPLIR